MSFFFDTTFLQVFGLNSNIFSRQLVTSHGYFLITILSDRQYNLSFIKILIISESLTFCPLIHFKCVSNTCKL